MQGGSFFGVVVWSGKESPEYVLKKGEAIHVSNAVMSLDGEKGKGGVTTLSVIVDRMKIDVCHLSEEKPQVNPDLDFGSDQTVSFVVKGPGVVSLTGKCRRNLPQNDSTAADSKQVNTTKITEYTRATVVSIEEVSDDANGKQSQPKSLENGSTSLGGNNSVGSNAAVASTQPKKKKNKKRKRTNSVSTEDSQTKPQTQSEPNVETQKQSQPLEQNDSMSIDANDSVSNSSDVSTNKNTSTDAASTQPQEQVSIEQDKTQEPPKKKKKLTKSQKAKKKKEIEQLEAQKKLDLIKNADKIENGILFEAGTPDGVVDKQTKSKLKIQKRFGLVFEDVKPGKGKLIAPGRMVSVAYKVYLRDGEQVDESLSPPLVFRFGVGQIVKGLDDGLKGMRVGGRRKIVVPPHLGYGAKQEGSIPPNSTLLFDVELIDSGEQLNTPENQGKGKKSKS